MSLNLDKAIRKHLKVFRWSLKVSTPEDRAYILPTLLNEFIGEIEVSAVGSENKEQNHGADCKATDSKPTDSVRCIAGKEKFHETSEMKGTREANLGMKVSEADSKAIHLWEFNGECPECGAPANHTIRACETGLSYCSRECAQKHVNKKEGGY